MTEFSRDMIEVQRLLAIVKNSLEEFNKSEGFLIKNDLSERCICAKFSTYLERELLNTQYQDYNVDVEYNRGRGGNDSAAKMMNGEYDNLICIEMKKEYKHLDMENDKKRLAVLTDKYCGFGYKLGLMLVARRDKKENICGLYIDSVYVDGRKIG